MNNIKALSFFLFMAIFKANFDQCMDISTFSVLNKQFMPDINLIRLVDNSHHLNKDKKKRLLGEGTFGKVYHVNFNISKRKTISTAMKVISPISSDIDKEIKLWKSEIQMLKKLFEYSPLHFIKFYGCAKQFKKSKKLLLFTEKLSVTLDRFTEPENSFNDFTFNTKLGLFLMMAQSLKILKDHKLAHLDVKPANFIYYDVGDIPIVKLIDYGFMHSHGAIFNGGSKLYCDPFIFDGLYKVSEYSDVYSLIITYIELLYGNKIIDMDSSCFEEKNKETLRNCYMLRNKIIEDEIASYEENLNKASPYMSQIKKLNKLLMIGLEQPKHGKITLELIIMVLERLLNQINPESLYLPKNNQKIIEKLYGKDFDDSSSFIWDLKQKTNENTAIKNNQLYKKKKLADNTQKMNHNLYNKPKNTLGKQFNKINKKSGEASRNDNNISIKANDSNNIFSGSKNNDNYQNSSLSSKSFITDITNLNKDIENHLPYYLFDENKDNEQKEMNLANINDKTSRHNNSKMYNQDIMNTEVSFKSNLSTKDQSDVISEKSIKDTYSALIEKHKKNPTVVNRLKEDMKKKLRELHQIKANLYSQRIRKGNNRMKVKKNDINNELPFKNGTRQYII